MQSHEVAKEAFLPPAWCAKAAEDLKGWTGQAVCWLAHDGNVSCDYHETRFITARTSRPFSRIILCRMPTLPSQEIRRVHFAKIAMNVQRDAPAHICIAVTYLNRPHPTSSVGTCALQKEFFWPSRNGFLVYPPPIYSGSTVECSGERFDKTHHLAVLTWIIQNLGLLHWPYVRLGYLWSLTWQVCRNALLWRHLKVFWNSFPPS